jgi:hypothetical protein
MKNHWVDSVLMKIDGLPRYLTNTKKNYFNKTRRQNGGYDAIIDVLLYL